MVMFNFLNKDKATDEFSRVESSDTFGDAVEVREAPTSSFSSFFSRQDGSAEIDVEVGELEVEERNEEGGGMFSSFRSLVSRGEPEPVVVEEPKKGMEQYMTQLKVFVGLEEEKPPEPETFQDKAKRKCGELGLVLCPCAQLSYTQRVIGFAVCAGLGLAFGALGVSVIMFPFTFCLLYSLCILCFLLSTFFLAGPLEQLKSMLQPHRIVSSLVFVGALIGTIVVAITVGSTLLVMIGIVVQTAALVWYVASYVPFARDAISSAFSGIGKAIVKS